MSLKAAVEVRLGGKLGRGEWQYLLERGRADPYKEAELDQDHEGLADAIEDAFDDVRALRAVRFTAPPEFGAREALGDRQNNELLRELFGNSPYYEYPDHISPMTVEKLAFGPGGEFRLDRGSFEFDVRCSLSEVQAQTARVWHHVVQRRWLRRSRPLGARKSQLIRYVCLDAPKGTTWRDRWNGWNAAFAEWAYADVRQFQSDFKRAELTLTGVPGALERLYEPMSALRYDQLGERAESG